MQMIPTGGVAVDPAEPTIAYVSDNTNKAIWVVNMTTGGGLAAGLAAGPTSSAGYLLVNGCGTQRLVAQ
jgi:hypothetical protein